MIIEGVHMKDIMFAMGRINTWVRRETDSETRVYKLMEDLYTAVYFYYNMEGKIFYEESTKK